MYCERCGPTVGEKNKHGFRNATSLMLTAGATMKVEKWHCRNCGGPVETEDKAQRRKAAQQMGAKATPEERRAYGETIERTGKAPVRVKKDGVEVEFVDGRWVPIEESSDAGDRVPDSETSKTNDPPATSEDVFDQVRKLADLRDAGVLTDEEFASKKAQLLDRL
jgi:hypothetical protein